MADFLLSPEITVEKDENDVRRDILNIRQEQSSASNLSKTGTPIASNKPIVHDITSPIEINLDDVSTCSTPCKRGADDDTPEVEICSSEKRQREQEESERLAWQLMQEESMNAYQMQVDYMRANPELFAEEDLAALGAVLQESQQQQPEEDEGEYDDDEEVEDNSQEWTYEQLLELGHTIGDVKTERWKMRSSDAIACLPRMTFAEYQNSHAVSNSSEEKDEDAGQKKEDQAEETCPVCMDCFEGAQEVAVLPCQHFFHLECCQGWLKENNSCPLCKKKITTSP